MKLYTEKQIKNAIIDFYKNDYLLSHSNLDKSISLLAPIELPSDEEIEKESFNYEFSDYFTDGAKWMKDKIQGGDK